MLAVTPHGSGPTEADIIRWIGVGVALAGVLIATPDGTAQAWRRIVAAGNWLRSQLARFLPFLRRDVSIQGVTAVDAGAATERVSVVRRAEWNVAAADHDKIEMLHQQVELLLQADRDIRQDIQERDSVLRTLIQQAEARLHDAHGELTRRLEATEQRSTKVDARGIWPIGFGIVLTGIPDELARIPVIGWLFVAGAVIWTIFAAIQGITDRTAHVGRLPRRLSGTAATATAELRDRRPPGYGTMVTITDDPA